jgi:hypothetical protein
VEEEQLKRKGEFLKKGRQKKMKPDYEMKKRKGMDKREITFEESKSDLPTVIDGNELYDDDVSDDGDFFTDRDVSVT